MPTSHLQQISPELLKRTICEETVRICSCRYGKSLRAIVLTGSLARDEATLIDEGMHWRLLGDAEFFLVFHDAAHLPSAADAEFEAREVKRALWGHGLIASVGLSPVDGSYFQCLPRYIATYELRSCGRVLWGDQGVLSLVPRFDMTEISLEDAWRMLANRIIEVLEVVAQSDHSQNARYRTVKLFLDIATSYLIFAGRYRPTYRLRQRELECMADDPSAQTNAPFPLGPLADRITECTRFKVGGHGMLSSTDMLLREAVGLAHLLWRWELKRLTGESDEISDGELMSRWMSQQPVRSKLRGWASLLRRSGGHHSWHEWPRWTRLARRASPRYYVYAVASETLFSLRNTDGQHAMTTDEIRNLAQRLPVLKQFGWEPCTQGWQRLISVTSLNYRRLLEDTIA